MKLHMLMLAGLLLSGGPVFAQGMTVEQYRAKIEADSARKVADSLQAVADSTKRANEKRSAALPWPGADLRRHTAQVAVEYDRFEKSTTVSLSQIELQQTNGLLYLYLGGYYTYPGQQPRLPARVTLMILSTSPSWRFLECHSVSLLIDGEAVRLPDVRHNGRLGSGAVFESVYAELPMPLFRRIVAADSVEGKVCNAEFAFDANAKLAWRDFASRMVAR